LLGNSAPTPDTQSDAPSVQAAKPESADIRRLPVDQIAVNPSQPRRQFNEESLQQLSESIRVNGLIQPVVVTGTPAGYELIAGERRLRAARLAGLADIPVIVRQVDAAAQARLALVENIHREDLNPIDRAESYRALMAASGCTQAELAEKLGEQRSTIANFLRLLELTAPVRQLVRDGSLSTGHAKVLAGLEATRQAALGQQCAEEQWSVRQLEAAIAAATLPAEPAATPAKAKLVSSPYLENLAKQLSHSLGLRVQVVKGAKKGTGRVVLNYASLDEFDALLRKLDVTLSDE